MYSLTHIYIHTVYVYTVLTSENVYGFGSDRSQEKREEMEKTIWESTSAAAAAGSVWNWAVVIGTAVAVAAGVWLVVVRRKMARKLDNDDGESDSKVPRGSSGWPLLGETLDFIASGYTSRPVSFMEKRKSL